MKKKDFTAIGIMTGTSMDGVDLSLIKSDGYDTFTTILNKFFKFDQKLLNNLINLRNKISSDNDLVSYSNELGSLDRDFTMFIAKVLNDLILYSNINVDLIGFHGQTIFHNPAKKISIQIGDGKLLSQLSKQIVISNFRQNDLDNGGQGAPLTPIFHKLLSKLISTKTEAKYPLNIINIGGITNITQIIFNSKVDDLDLFASDIGPGNCLIDKWIRKNSIKSFDTNGEIAKAGVVNELIYNQAVENFSNISYDKSLDINDFDISFAKGLSLEDGCATVTKFTAHLIANGIRYINNRNKNLPVFNLICGGGRKNPTLIENINDSLNYMDIDLIDIDNYNFDGDFIESQAFGYLAIRAFLNLPISFPSTTGCQTPTVGGFINKNF